MHIATSQMMDWRRQDERPMRDKEDPSQSKRIRERTRGYLGSNRNSLENRSDVVIKEKDESRVIFRIPLTFHQVHLHFFLPLLSLLPHLNLYSLALR